MKHKNKNGTVHLYLAILSLLLTDLIACAHEGILRLRALERSLDNHDDIVKTRAKPLGGLAAELLSAAAGALETATRKGAQTRPDARNTIRRALTPTAECLEKTCDGLAAAWPPTSPQGIVAAAAASELRGITESLSRCLGEAVWCAAVVDDKTEFNELTLAIAQRLRCVSAHMDEAISDAVTRELTASRRNLGDKLGAALSGLAPALRIDAATAMSYTVSKLQNELRVVQQDEGSRQFSALVQAMKGEANA